MQGAGACGAGVAALEAAGVALLAGGSVAAVLSVAGAPPRAGWLGAARELARVASVRGKTAELLGPPPGRGPLAALRALTVPQGWFTHFYALGTGSLGFALWRTYGCVPGNVSVALACLVAHAARRFLEAAFVQEFAQTARQNVLGYLFGCCYYVALPVMLLEGRPHLGCLCSPAAAGAARPAAVFGRVLRSPRGLLGVSAYVWGSAEQSVAHYQLASLRRGRGGAPGRKLYSQPAGRLFDLVSCPHYLLEILLYAGVLAVAAEGLWQPKAALLLVWLGTNLGSAARNSHTWYRRKFEGYPPSRKALVPYLW